MFKYRSLLVGGTYLMCGFAGFTGNIKNREDIIKNMTDKIIHRGPDSSGSYSDENITLGFRRLSIIGLENGSQPIFNEDKTLAIVFNGEIYNYKELKQSLIEKGHIFETNTDTEVLIHLYEEEEENMLNLIRGMFAFVIYDFNEEKVFAVRDFFGIKPFYYSLIEGNLVFGSEIKSILEYPKYKKEVNKVALENYLSFQYSVLEETFFKNIYKLNAGSYLIFKNNELKIEKYFNPLLTPENSKLQSKIEEVENVLKDSINFHKVSDVEIGSFLSSGVDSSFIASNFGGKKTFTVGFEYDNYNEIEYAKSLCAHLNIENNNKIVTKEEYWKTLPKVQYYMDEPLADPSAIALYFVAKLASKKVKVALSGEGADELFGGYNIYKEPFDISLITILPKFLRNLFAKFVNLIPFNFKGKNLIIRASKNVEERFIGNANIFSKQEREKILKNPTGKFNTEEITKPFYNQVKNLDDASKMQFLDINLWLTGDILLKADKMSMANSLEVRVPFLDKEVFKVAKSIQSDYKVNKQSTKYIFRMVAKKYLPDSVANKKKLGFPVPIRIWLKEDKYYNNVKEYFNSKSAKEFFNIEEINNYLEQHKNGKVDFSRKIWTIYVFLIWHEQFFKEA